MGKALIAGKRTPLDALRLQWPPNTVTMGGGGENRRERGVKGGEREKEKIKDAKLNRCAIYLFLSFKINFGLF